MLNKPKNGNTTVHHQMATQPKGKAGSEHQNHGDQKCIKSGGGTKMMSPVKH